MMNKIGSNSNIIRALQVLALIFVFTQTAYAQPLNQFSEESIKQAALAKVARMPDLLPPDHSPFEVGTVRIVGDWAILNLVAFPQQVVPDADFIVPYVLLAVAHVSDSNEVEVLIETDTAYPDAILQVPEELLSQESKSNLLRQSPQDNRILTTYQIPGLPWQKGLSWHYTQGPHGGSQDAFDFATPNHTSDRVHAADSGTVVYSTETCMGVSRPSDGLRLWYQHIRPSDIDNFPVGTSVSLDQTIGMTTLEPGCGGTSTGHHVHFYFDYYNQPVPSEGSSMNGWVSVGQNLVKDGLTVTPYTTGGDLILYSDSSGNDDEVIVVEDPNIDPAYGGGMCDPDSPWYRFTNNRGHDAYLTVNTNDPNLSTNSATWRPDLPYAGTWKVEAYIANHNPINWQCPSMYLDSDTSDAHYTIYHANGSTPKSGNQLPLANAWLDLGTYEFTSGTGGYIKLVDLNDEANFSRTVSFSAMRFTLVEVNTPPSSPTLDTISNDDGDGAYPVSWNSTSGATRYELQEDENSSFSSPIEVHDASGTSWNASGQDAGTYYYRVRACNSTGCSNWSNTRSTTVCATASTPILVSPTNGAATSDATPSFDWNDAANAAAYQLQAADNAAFSNPTIDVLTTGSNYTAANALTDDTWYWRVRARNGCQVYGAWSSTWSFVLSTLTPPSSPTLDAISNADGDGAYTVSWNSSNGATWYDLQEDANSSFSSPTEVYDNSGTSWSASGQDAGTYYYRVRACNSAGCSNWSNTQSTTVTADPAGTYASIALPTTTGYVGASLTANIVISDVSNLGSFEFTFTYDPALVSVTEVTLGDFPESSGRDFTTMPTEISPTLGTVTFGAYSMGSSPAGATGTGVLAQVQLELLAPGQTILGFDNLQVATVPGENVPVSTQDTALEISNCLGDFDGDGDVDISDIQKIAYRWNAQTGEALYALQYDLDGNGRIDIGDIQKVAYRWNTVCGTGTQGVCAPGITAEPAALSLQPEVQEIQVSETFTVGVLISDVVDLGAYEFTLGYDAEVLEVSEVTLGTLPESTGRDFIAVGPEISPTLGTVSFGAYSQGSTPAGAFGDGQLAVLTLRALAAGTSPLTFDSAQITNIAGDLQVVDPLIASEITVKPSHRVYLPLTLSRYQADTLQEVDVQNR
jgi:hypothetical protein